MWLFELCISVSRYKKNIKNDFKNAHFLATNVTFKHSCTNPRNCIHIALILEQRNEILNNDDDVKKLTIERVWTFYGR